MPEGRTLPYCGKACRRVLRRPSTLAATGPALDVFGELLDRMEGVIASRVGAGATIDAAWDGARWRRELAADLPGVAAPVLDAVRARLDGASTAAQVHEAFASIRSRLAAARQRIA